MNINKFYNFHSVSQIRPTKYTHCNVLILKTPHVLGLIGPSSGSAAVKNKH